MLYTNMSHKIYYNSGWKAYNSVKLLTHYFCLNNNVHCISVYVHWIARAPSWLLILNRQGSLPCRTSCFTCRKNWYLIEDRQMDSIRDALQSNSITRPKTILLKWFLNYSADSFSRYTQNTHLVISSFSLQGSSA